MRNIDSTLQGMAIDKWLTNNRDGGSYTLDSGQAGDEDAIKAYLYLFIPVRQVIFLWVSRWRVSCIYHIRIPLRRRRI